MLKLWGVVFVAVIAIGLAAGQAFAIRSGGYPAEAIAGMQQSCARSFSEAECRCALDRAQVEITYDNFLAMDQAMREQRIHPASVRWATIVGECQTVGEGLRALPESGYSDGYVQNFMNSCSQGTPAGYCECSIEGMQREIPVADALEYDLLASWDRANEHPRYNQIIGIYQGCLTQTRPQSHKEG
ncbi:MAG: hypothetical protein J0L81_09645 [Caulobacterales bacterium]|nr:hypothetical protein [Caulobacterales bacterium]